MCLIKFRPSAEEEEPAVPNRPLTALHHSTPPSRAGPSPAAHLASNLSQKTSSLPDFPSQTLSREPPPPQVVIIQQRTTPRASGLLIPEEGLRVGHQNSEEADGKPVDQRRHRRTSSAAGKGLGPGPRESTASHRSTRDRIVVVDSEGSRRKYYR